MEHRYKSIKDISHKYSISISTLYRLIKTDPIIPAYNAGFKKKYIIDDYSFPVWLKNRYLSINILTGEEILRRSHAKRC